MWAYKCADVKPSPAQHSSCCPWPPAFAPSLLSSCRVDRMEDQCPLVQHLQPNKTPDEEVWTATTPLRIDRPKTPPPFLTVIRIGLFNVALVSLPPDRFVLCLLSLSQVASVAAILLRRLQVFNVDLVMWHRTQWRYPFTKECCHVGNSYM